MTRPKPSLLLIGLDGVGPEILDPLVEAGDLPNLSRLMDKGAYGPLRSTTPPTTFPAWSSFLTGAEPSSHGIPDFTIRKGYRISFAGAADRRAPTWMEHLESLGLRVGVAWFPMTYPPLPLCGYHISGWDSPVTSRGDSSFVHPGALHTDLATRFGEEHLSFDTIDEFSDTDNWHIATAGALLERIEKRTEIALHMLANYPVDVAAFYFGQTDTAAHHFFAFHDPASPRRPETFDPRLSHALRNVYIAADEAVGRLVDAVGDDTTVMVMSDHGSGGSSDIAIYLNRMLQRAGLLEFRSAGRQGIDPSFIRGKAVGLLPRRLRRPLFRFSKGLVPALVESQLRMGGIDWSRTVAFSEEINYAPSIWFNQLGREPDGAMPFAEREHIASRVEEAALGLATPDGARLVHSVIRREEIHHGAHLHRFPDLILELANVDGFTPVCLSSRARNGNPVERLESDAMLGRKGRSMPGCHTPDGILMLNGPGVPQKQIEGARIHDVPMLICAATNTPAAPWFEGTSPHGLMKPPKEKKTDRSNDLVSKETTRSYTRAQEKVVAERLRRLGYFED